MSCATTAPNNNPIERPEVPNFYNERGEVLVKYDESADEVSLPLFIWKRIVRYIIGAEAALDIAEGQIKKSEQGTASL